MNTRRISVKKLFEQRSKMWISYNAFPHRDYTIEQRQKRIVKNEYETKW